MLDDRRPWFCWHIFFLLLLFAAIIGLCHDIVVVAAPFRKEIILWLLLELKNFVVVVVVVVVGILLLVVLSVVNECVVVGNNKKSSKKNPVRNTTTSIREIIYCFLVAYTDIYIVWRWQSTFVVIRLKGWFVPVLELWGSRRMFMNQAKSGIHEKVWNHVLMWNQAEVINQVLTTISL